MATFQTQRWRSRTFTAMLWSAIFHHRNSSFVLAYLSLKSSSERQATEVSPPLPPDRLSTTSSSFFGTDLLGLGSCHLCRALGTAALRDGLDNCTVFSGTNNSGSFRLLAKHLLIFHMAPAAIIQCLDYLAHGLRLLSSSLVLRRYVDDDAVLTRELGDFLPTEYSK
ncbi:hypothetical protein BKA61DRAFT_94580 [Leptodontidium sp. MPI-SDFR-AT-0119]|nr:hypothetical protein BKA61DRAFT_94580 [Leptodontidium sp. MPI-SDFR-AT-0119]